MGYNRVVSLFLVLLALAGAGAKAMDGFDDSCQTGPKIQIGGSFTVASYGRWVEGYKPDAAVPLTEVRQLQASDFQTDTASFTFKITPQHNPDSFLTVRFQLDEAWGRDGTLAQDDLLREAYYTFQNLCGSGFGVRFGKMRVPFGLDNDVLILHPYLDGTSRTMFRARFNGLNPPSDSFLSPFTGDYAFHDSTHWNRLFAVTPFWQGLDKKLLVEATLFQAKRDINGDRRSNDDLFFKSGSLKATYKPVEGLSLQGSLMARYNDRSAKSSNPRHTDRMYASSLSAMYDFSVACRPVNVFMEWQHSWNSYNDSDSKTGNSAYFFKDTGTDDLHFGMACQVTDVFRAHLQGEWLLMRNSRQNFGGTHDADSRMWRAVFALETKLPGGIVMESGYQHEWLKRRNAVANNTAGLYDPATKSQFQAGTWYSGLKFAF